MIAGERLGKYRMVAPMGPNAWLAERAEDFEQQVLAVLIPQALALEVQQNFLDRRQKLAALQHPAIPRLLDSGETSANLPYVLFEFNPAEPALAWASAQKSTLEQRLALALEFLDALALAHRNLIAHGQLCMDSFQVTATGQCRLPAFPCLVSSADPVAADISAMVEWMAKLVAESGTPRLPRDLQAILKKATATDSAFGYESAYALAADVRSFLAQRPVSARRAGPIYRSALYARRRPELFYPGVLVFATVLFAAAYSLVMDSAAERSRTQAQARLRQLQRLTYALESDLYRPVSALPNSKTARDTLIQWAAGSLDGLSSDAGNDAELRSQLSHSYERLAEMQRGNGDAAGALISEQHAHAVLRPAPSH